MSEREINLAAINQRLRDASPDAIVRWALERSPARAIVSTNFGPFEAVILHLCATQRPEIPVIWADTGYNTPETYRFADALTRRLGLQLRVFHPRRSRAHREAVEGPPPAIEDEAAHRAFTEEVKLEPFRRALAAQAPEVWLTALRKEQTPYRQTLDVVTRDPGGPLKVSPVFHWTVEQLQAYLDAHELPNENIYHDPTKVLAHRECGLHPGFFAKGRAQGDDEG